MLDGMADEIRDQIEADALKPASITADGQTVVKRPLRELIEADRHIRGAAAAAQPHFGIRISQIVPPGGE